MIRGLEILIFVFAAGWKRSKSSGRSILKELFRHLDGFSWSWRAPSSGLCCLWPQQPRREEAEPCLPPLPFPQQMQECFDVHFPNPSAQQQD